MQISNLYIHYSKSKCYKFKYMFGPFNDSINILKASKCNKNGIEYYDIFANYVQIYTDNSKIINHKA